MKKKNYITLRSIFLGIFLSIIFNIIYFKNINNESLMNILSKSVSYNYLSIEPFFLRGSFVESFDIQCYGYECLPFVKKKKTNRIEFINELNKVLEKDQFSMVFVSMLLVDTKFLDLRFYINNPIFIDTKVLGIAYYTSDIFVGKYRTRFSVGYNYHLCNGSLKEHKNQLRVEYLDDLVSIFNLKKNCEKNSYDELKNLKVKYIIDEKQYLNKKNIIFCKNNFCLAYI